MLYKAGKVFYYISNREGITPIIKKGEKVKTLTKENLIEAGGKLWEKGSMIRVYLNSETCKKMFEDAGYKAEYSAMEEKSLEKAKTFFDIKTGSLKSDIGTVRAMFNSKGWECSK